MVIELTAIRGLLKKKFPSTKSGTVDVDLAPIVRKLKSGIKIQVQRTDREPDFAWIECPIGKVRPRSCEVIAGLFKHNFVYDFSWIWRLKI